MSTTNQRITATQVYSQVEIEAWWRDWCAYLESHLAVLDARLAGDRAVFERDDATAQQRTLAQQRLQAIAATRRSVFDRVRESLRQAEQVRQESAGRALAPLEKWGRHEVDLPDTYPTGV